MNSLGWQPDKNSPVPLHEQIAKFIRDKISSGEWSLGSRLPTQRQFAMMFDVNRSTVVSALEELVADGLLEGKTRSGTRVVNNSWTLLASEPSPDWDWYVKAGLYQPNLPTIQEINRVESDPDVIRLGTGELSAELFPTDRMKDVLMRVANDPSPLSYEEPKGSWALRQEISRYLRTHGIVASPSAILVVSGALQALHLISIGLLQRESTVFLENPSYLYSLHVFQSAGIRFHGLPMDEQGLQPWDIALHKKKCKGAFLYTIPSFHNPTGILMSEQRRNEVLKTCEEDQLPIIEDDVYRELWIDAPSPAPLKAYDNNGIVLYLGSLSKTLSPGLRIGWVVGPEAVIDRLADIKMQTDYGSSSLSQRVAAEWLATGWYAEHLERVRQQLRVSRDFMIEVLRRYCQDIAAWVVPSGGFYIWVKIIADISVRQLFDRALAEGILLNPGHVYNQKDGQYIRLSYSYASMTEIETGIMRLSRIIRDLMPHR